MNGYIYRHIRVDTNEVFYIGSGGFDKSEEIETYKRAFTKKNRNKYWRNIINKTDYEVEILIEGLNYEETIKKEIEFISLYGRKDLNKGSLVNMTDGGEGIKNCSIESKEKISKTNKGKKFSEEHKLKLSIARKNRIIKEETKRKISESNKGKKHTPEIKEHLSKVNFGKKHTEETKQKIVKIHKGKKLSQETKQKISESHKGKVSVVEHTTETKIKISNSLKGHISPKRRKIICIENNIVYNSITEASKLLNISQGNLSEFLKGKRTHVSGLHFTYI